MAAWDKSKSPVARERFNTASDIMKIGQVLTTTELRSTRTYWHVQSKTNVYPDLYTPRAIGIMWQTMAQFQTWFGGAQYLAYGIQILPLTPISEFRDTVEWGAEMYPTFADSCMQSPSCEKDGWSILQYAVLATLGHDTTAANSTLNLKAPVFESSGGNGHSLTNSLWFVATRPEIPPLPIKLLKHTEDGAESGSDKPYVDKVRDCGLPRICTKSALDTAAGPFTCRERINWLMAEQSLTEENACIQVSKEFLVECGACAPATPNECLPCSSDQCNTMSRCPIYGRTFVCLEGGARGGCSESPWEISLEDWAPCKRCCELTHCRK
jgi:Glycosyl hydrolase family 81 C-terminal domain